MKKATREVIDAIAQSVKSKISGGSLFGEPIDTNDLNSMIVAAWELGKADERTINNENNKKLFLYPWLA